MIIIIIIIIIIIKVVVTISLGSDPLSSSSIVKRENYFKCNHKSAIFSSFIIAVSNVSTDYKY